jgi:hypothetical protein
MPTWVAANLFFPLRTARVRLPGSAILDPDVIALLARQNPAEIAEYFEVLLDLLATGIYAGAMVFAMQWEIATGMWEIQFIHRDLAGIPAQAPIPLLEVPITDIELQEAGRRQKDKQAKG